MIIFLWALSFRWWLYLSTWLWQLSYPSSPFLLHLIERIIGFINYLFTSVFYRRQVLLNFTWVDSLFSLFVLPITSDLTFSLYELRLINYQVEYRIVAETDLALASLISYLPIQLRYFWCSTELSLCVCLIPCSLAQAIIFQWNVKTKVDIKSLIEPRQA